MNGDQATCESVPTACQWNDPNCDNLAAGCSAMGGSVALLDECDILEGQGAGCQKAGQCDDAGACSACGTESECDTDCGTAGCSWSGANLVDMFEIQWGSLTEEGEVSNCYLNYTNQSAGAPGAPTNYEIEITKIGAGHNTYCIYNFTDVLTNTLYVDFFIKANDSEDQWGESEERTVYFDLISPEIAYELPTPTNNTYVGASYVYINISADEVLGNQSLLWATPNGTGFVWDIYNMTYTYYNSTHYFYGYNKTGLMDQSYWYWVYTEDEAGNDATLPNRTLIIETEGPTLTFVQPTPLHDSFLIGSYFTINVSSNKHLNYSILEFGGTNITTNHTTGYATHNMTGLTYGRYRYKFYGNSTITGIWGETEYRTIRINPEGSFGQTFLLLAILLIPSILVFFGWKTGNWVFTMLASFIFLIWGVYFYLYPLVDINYLINLVITLVSFGVGAYLLGATAVELVGRID